jgi:hypothetical protein
LKRYFRRRSGGSSSSCLASTARHSPRNPKMLAKLDVEQQTPTPHVLRRHARTKPHPSSPFLGVPAVTRHCRVGQRRRIRAPAAARAIPRTKQLPAHARVRSPPRRSDRHGLRASEIVALRWDDIDLATGRLHVRRAKGGDADVLSESQAFLGPSSTSVVVVPLGQFYADETLIPGDRRGAAKSPPVYSRSRFLAIDSPRLAITITGWGPGR